MIRCRLSTSGRLILSAIVAWAVVPAFVQAQRQPGPLFRGDPADDRVALQRNVVRARSSGTRTPRFSDLDPSLRKLDDFLQPYAVTSSVEPIDVILTLAGPMVPEYAREITQLSGVVRIELDSAKLLAVTVPALAIPKLAASHWIKRISKDVMVSKLDEFTVGSSLAEVASARFSVDGSGIRVAVLDSGIQHVPDLAGRIVASKSFIPGDLSAEDACGHGTHVAGVIGGDGTKSSGPNMFRTFQGIAPKADLVNVRVLNSYGYGSVSTIIEGIDWVIANKNAINIRVMNLSLGHQIGESYLTDPLCRAVERAWKAGIVVVSAAGNGGRLNSFRTAGLDNEGFGSAYGSITSPGNSPYCITVGATKTIDGLRVNDRIGTYSARGPTRFDFILKPDIVAPGNRVISLRDRGSYLDSVYASTNTVPLESYKTVGDRRDSSDYFEMSGTSISAPVVSGAAALMLQNNPALSPDTVKARLMIAADKIAGDGGVFDTCTFGAGYLNILAALECEVVARGTALSPTLRRTESGTVVIGGTEIMELGGVWGIEGIWRLNVIWGDYIAPSAGITDNVIWGSQTLWDAAVWSDNIIWGSKSDDDMIISITGED